MREHRSFDDLPPRPYAKSGKPFPSETRVKTRPAFRPCRRAERGSSTATICAIVRRRPPTFQNLLLLTSGRHDGAEPSRHFSAV